MKKLIPTTKFKKDYKRYRNNPKKVEKLFENLSRKNLFHLKTSHTL